MSHFIQNNPSNIEKSGSVLIKWCNTANWTKYDFTGGEISITMYITYMIHDIYSLIDKL